MVAADPDPKRREGSPTPAWLRGVVVWMDEAIPLPFGMRMGIDPILGLLAPGVGDGISAATHLTLLWAAFRARVPRATLVRMVLNAAIDAAVGAIPFAGDLFDVGFKANRKNLALLERMERQARPRATLGDYAFLAGIMALLLLVLLIPLLLVLAVGAAILEFPL
jgi:hypothetical protein